MIVVFFKYILIKLMTCQRDVNQLSPELSLISFIGRLLQMLISNLQKFIPSTK